MESEGWMGMSRASMATAAKLALADVEAMLVALRSLPVEQRMEAMGMVRTGDPSAGRASDVAGPMWKEAVTSDT